MKIQMIRPHQHVEARCLRRRLWGQQELKAKKRVLSLFSRLDRTWKESKKGLVPSGSTNAQTDMLIGADTQKA